MTTNSKPTTEYALCWVDGRYGTKYGYVGSLNTPVCTLGWGLVRGAEKPWTLRMDLPGYQKTDRPVADADEAEALVLRIVARFVDLLTAPSASAPVIPGGQRDNTE